MSGEPAEPFAQSRPIASFHDKTRYSVIDDFRHARNSCADHRCAAGHRFQQGLSQELGHLRLGSIRAIDTRQDQTQRTPIRIHEADVIEVVPECDGFPFGFRLHHFDVAVGAPRADDVQGHVLG